MLKKQTLNLIEASGKQ